MSTDQSTARGAPTSHGGAKLVQFDAYIDAQVESTRRLVKVVDLATSLVGLAAGVLAYLLAVAVVEHWLVPGGFPFAIRVALFVLLTGSVAYFAYRRLWPLVLRRINPVYAAQAIELSGPSLKNSLINLLLFRQRRSEISDAVYQTLEEQAAQRLSRVPVDAAVDRSLLIRFGYVLLVVVAAASLYKVLSPKDPLVAAQRVLMPWADIVPASRVSITGVEPGAVTVSRGEFVDVSAEVRGLDESDPVLLRFTTEDGQAVNKPVPMRLARDGLRFEARLPVEEDERGVGITQNLRYRIEAGDARSLDFDVNVVAAPTMLVTSVAYDYPAYTNYIDREVEGLGDIRAIEGTRVTIRARANGTIREAHIDFDADGRRDLAMTSEGQSARTTFELRLRDDRRTPRHASYVLRFTNDEGRGNRDPVKYSIAVEPDLGPEASILLPREKELSVRLDETVSIEVEARDPDFALSEVRLHGETAGRAVLDEELLKGLHSGRFSRRYRFTPRAHDLRAGNVLEYWVTAADNRTPEPNSVASERKVLRIVSADPAQPPPDRLAQNEPRRGQQDEQQRNDGEQPGPPQKGDGKEGQGGEQQPGAAGQGERRDSQQPPGEQREGERGGEGTVDRDAPPNAGKQRQKNEEPGENGQSGEMDQQGEQHGGREGQGRPGEPGSNDKQTGAGAAGGESTHGGSRPDGARPEQRTAPRSADGPRPGGDAQGEHSAEQSPVSSDGDNDAEAFERIRRHLQRDGALPESDSNAADGTEEPVRRDAQRSAEERQGDKGTERQRGEDSANENGAPNEQSRSEPSGMQNDRQGRGAETKGGASQDSPEEADEQQAADSPGGGELSPKAPSGAGEEEQPQGAPNSQPGMKPGDKRPQARPEGENSDGTEPPAGGRGQKESDSQGEQGGDRAGGGEEGGGQKAPRDGTGSAGQNQSADEGAGESTEQGPGTDSPNAGQDSTAADRTGQSGEETTGRGSKQRDGAGQRGEGARHEGQRDAEQESSEGRETGSQRDGELGDEDAPARSGDDSNSAQNAIETTGERGRASGDGGERGVPGQQRPRREGSVPEGDEANLEYARKQTDLVLEKLADQLKQQEVDEKLLEELGWSEAELQKFVERWQARKEAAQRNDPPGDTAKRELDEALRSLGLRRGPLQQGPLKEDSIRDLREGYRGAVPLKYRERLRAYSEGISRARQDEE